MAREHDPFEDTLETVPGLKQIKVSRRYQRAFERLSGPLHAGSGVRGASPRALALALVLLVFASGFLLGRVGSVGSGGGPVVRELPAVEALAPLEVKGTVAYALRSRELVTIAMQDAFSGDVTARARLSPPFDPGDHVTTSVVSFGRSVAVVVISDGEGFVAFAPHGHAPQGWVAGVQAAWSSEEELLVRHVDGTVTEWSVGSDAVASSRAGDADDLLQTAAGPVVRRGDQLETTTSPTRRLALPDGTDPDDVVAISPDMTRALLDADVPTLWDGEELIAMRTGDGEILGASFERSSERVAVVLRTEDGLHLGVVDQRGNAQLKSLGRGDGCEGAPAWDADGAWVYVAGGDGTLHAVEADGGRVGSVRTHGAGCGAAWLDIT